MPAERALETYLALLLAGQSPALAEAHDELYPERVPEGIPLSITLLYPFARAADADEHRGTLGSFFAAHPPFEFELAGLGQWEESGAVYAVPRPEQPLRDLMRALWRLFPQFPPYREPGSDPPPHASLTYTGGDDRVATRRRVERRLDGLLPVPFRVSEVTLMEEAGVDSWRPRETFRLGA